MILFLITGVYDVWNVLYPTFSTFFHVLAVYNLWKPIHSYLLQIAGVLIASITLIAVTMASNVAWLAYASTSVANHSITNVESTSIHSPSAAKIPRAISTKRASQSANERAALTTQTAKATGPFAARKHARAYSASTTLIVTPRVTLIPTCAYPKTHVKAWLARVRGVRKA